MKIIHLIFILMITYHHDSTTADLVKPVMMIVPTDFVRKCFQKLKLYH